MTKEEDDDTIFEAFPCKINIFAEFTPLSSDHDTESYSDRESTMIAIVQVAKDTPKNHSLLSKTFHLESELSHICLNDGTQQRKPKFTIVDVGSFSHTCLCLPSYHNDSSKWFNYTLILPKEEWGDKFCGQWNDEETGIYNKSGRLLRCGYK